MKKRIIIIGLLCISLFATTIVLSSKSANFGGVYAEEPGEKDCIKFDQMAQNEMTDIFCKDRHTGQEHCYEETWLSKGEKGKCTLDPPPSPY